MERLEAYIPMDRRQAMVNGRDLPDRTSGAALFADVSGFTLLTEALVKSLQPKRAAEEITHQLNRVYEALIAEVHRYGGSVIGFVGDAITCWFDAGPAAALTEVGLQATACGLTMQRAMVPFARVELPAGDSVALAIKVAIATGPARRFLVGDPDIQYIDTLAGMTLQQMAAAEKQAEKGEVVLPPEAAAQLAGNIIVADRREGLEPGQFFTVVSDLTVPVAPAPWPNLPPAALTEKQVRPWLIAPVYDRLRAGQAQYLAEMRPAVALFLRFGGLDYEQDAAAGQKLDHYLRWVQQVLARYEGYLLQLTIGDKGSFIYAAFGAPITHGDDPVRAAAAALDLRTPPVELASLTQGLDVNGVQIGLSQGQMRTGAYGGSVRRTYGVISNEVNMAARLMGKAAPGQIMVSGHIAEALVGSYHLEDIGPIKVKGKAEPIPVFLVLGRRLPAARRPVDLFASPLVGRDAELARMEQILVTASSRAEGQILRVEGEAGIGKSHLMAELAGRALQQGWHVVQGFCQSTSQDIAYHPWRQIFRLLFQLTDQPNEDTEPKTSQIEQVQTALEAINPDWLVRLPLLGDLLNLPIPDNATTSAFEPQLRREALLTLAVDLILHWAQDTRLIILLIEDVHWADEASQELIISLGRVIGRGPVALVLVQRPPLDRHQPVLPELERLPNSHHIDLGELSPSGVEALVANRLGGQPSALLLDLIRIQTKGNPFFVEELIEALREADHLSGQQDGSWTLSERTVTLLHQTNSLTRNEAGQLALNPAVSLSAADLGLPDSIHGLILSRLDRLAESHKLTLKVASVIGRIIDFEILRLAHPLGTDDKTLIEQIKTVEGQEFVRLERPSPNLAYIFKHNITRDVTYETLLEAQRRQLHREVGTAMETLFPESVEQLALHYSRAKVRNKSLLYLDKAARKAERNYANETALNYYNQALALEERWEWRQGQINVLHILGQRAEERAGLERLEANPATPTSVTVYLWGQYYEAVGDYSRAQTAIESALDAARQQNNRLEEIRSLSQLGLIARRQGNYRKAMGWYDQALNMIPEGYEHTPEILQALARALAGLGIVYRQQGDLDQARAYYEQALTLSRRSGDRWNEAQALDNLGTVAYHQRRLTGAIPYHQQALQIRRVIGNRSGEGISLMNLAQINRDAGNYGQAAQYLSEALTIQQSTGNRWEEINVWNDLGILYQELGDLVAAQDSLKQGLELAREIDDEEGQAYLLSNLGLVVRDQGDLKEATRLLTDGLVIMETLKNKHQISFFLNYLSTVSLQAGNYQQAIDQASVALTLRQELGLRVRTADDLANLAAAHLAINNLDQAITYADQSLAILEECGGEGPEFPQRDYFICYQVLVTVGQKARALVAMRSAYDLVMARSAQITDPAQRRSFLEQVAVNREIVTEARRVLAIDS